MFFSNKKVLLCDRKRHTTRCAVSTCSSLSGERGTPSPSWGEGCSVPDGEVPQSQMGGGVLQLGYPSPRPGGYPVSARGTPVPGKDLGPETKERSWDWGTPRKDLGIETRERTWDWGTPLWTDRLTPVKTLPSRFTMYAGGKKKIKIGRNSY